jgi:hypothetical protein
LPVEEVPLNALEQRRRGRQDAGSKDQGGAQSQDEGGIHLRLLRTWGVVRTPFIGSEFCRTARYTCASFLAIPMKNLPYDRITTTIERQWLAEIIAGTKKIEYRRIKPYWTQRFKKVSLPFELRLLNGMNPPVPEVTVLIHRITRRAGEYRLHINKVLNYKHWDKRGQRPKR